MDFQRIFLFSIFAFSGIFLWNAYNHPENGIDQFASTQVAPVIASTAVLASSGVPARSPVIVPPANSVVEKNVSADNKIIIRTDNLIVEISRQGGDIQRVELLKHKSFEDKNKSFVLLQNDSSVTYVTQSGLLGENLPDHHASYVAEKAEYSLAEGLDSLTVTLSNSSGVRKVYVFHRNSYLIDVSYEIDNHGTSPLVASSYFQLVRDDSTPAGGTMMVPTYTGPAIYTDLEKFQKIDFAEIQKNKVSYPAKTDNGWIAMLQHYFVSAWLPPKLPRENYTKSLGNNLYAVGSVLQLEPIAAGQTGGIKTQLYVGPASTQLDEVAPGLGLTVDYGWLTIIANPLFWMLTLIQGWVINWGLAIIVLTVLIKLVFFPLSAASYKSMAKMRVVAPKLEKIKQQYGDDREKLNRAMMDLYKTEKINPLGGCLPVLIQIPVFISLYWAILSSVELRNAPFIGWISDLSAADPYYVLPAIMGISMFIQGRLNPTPPDPIQAKLMQIMPVLFSVVFFFFPAGLVLYSVVNNVLSIWQQWYITRQQEREYSVAANH
jgi:YidC/Oxa1 family membrane protein insertase